jgi:hypothetical protein
MSSSDLCCHRLTALWAQGALRFVQAWQQQPRSDPERPGNRVAGSRHAHARDESSKWSRRGQVLRLFGRGRPLVCIHSWGELEYLMTPSQKQIGSSTQLKCRTCQLKLPFHPFQKMPTTHKAEHGTGQAECPILVASHRASLVRARSGGGLGNGNHAANGVACEVA